jgi:hypothetical protein
MKINKKKCPSCGKDQIYKRRNDLLGSIKKNTKCRSCASRESSTGESNPMYGKKHSEETKEKIRLKRMEQITTAETRAKMSKSQGKRVHDNKWQPQYNPSSIPIIEQYGKEYGYNFKHAENGGEFYIEELGYWVDGYDSEQNVVIEYDESRHFNKNGELKEKDKIRQKEITDLLNCKFIRIRETNIF